MASGGVLTHPLDVTSRTMKGDKLTVQGTGITPRATSPATSGADPAPGAQDLSSRSSMTSDDDVTRSVDDAEANEMLQGVMSMNEILQGQIEALRLRLQVEDKQHREDKSKLRQEKDGVIVAKESEIEDLRDSLTNRDERIHHLVQASQEKDRTIQAKVGEIEELKTLVKQTEDYAHKLHRQIGQVKHKKEALETDTLYKEQNAEIGRLSEELVELKKRLCAMEQELQRAAKIMEQQTSRIRQLEDERGSMQSHFKEELEKATRAMRQEVERMRAVMRQNYEEMRQLREQNRQMHSDVRDIKDLLLKNKTPPSSRDYKITSSERPFTASSMTLLPVEYTARTPSPSKWTSHQRRPNLGVGVKLSEDQAPSSTRGNVTSRAVSRSSAAPASARKSSVTTGAKAAATEHQKKTPAICGLKEGPVAGHGHGLPLINRQPTNLQLRSKSALRLASAKGAKK